MKTYQTMLIGTLMLLSNFLLACSSNQNQDGTLTIQSHTLDTSTDSISSEKTTLPPLPKEYTTNDIELSHHLLYRRYTLTDSYPYKDTTRCFQWKKIKAQLAILENMQLTPKQWGILQNYKNKNGEAALVKRHQRNEYNLVTDTLGIERYQSVPLYLRTDTITPELYAQDGDLAQLFEETASFTTIIPFFIGDVFQTPKRYIKPIGDTIIFQKAIFIDRTNQNIATLERKSPGKWIVRSMNPATTGQYKPPYAHPTPLGMYVLQEKKEKMFFYKDGTTELGGYAPYASRFTDGAYIHGIPVNHPRSQPIEYSSSLGTTPRSHMCVRNATSHAKFIFDWAPVNETIVFVLE
ncbi:MAG: murein L,D-transpeptidase [Bacteroidia bacterium]|nr:murein L,D-transpeptidase [Bacteroidia bacterium]